MSGTSWHVFWLWVYYNSATLQTVINLVGVVGLVWTLSTAFRSAHAAENAAEVSLKQLAYNVHASDKAAQPLLDIEFFDNPDTSDTFIPSSAKFLKITNVGLGPAWNLTAHLTMKPERHLLLKTSSLGVTKRTWTWCLEKELDVFGVTVSYYSSLGRKHERILRLDAQSLEYVQSDKSFPAAIDDLFDLSFVKKLQDLARKNKVSDSSS